MQQSFVGLGLLGSSTAASSMSFSFGSDQMFTLLCGRFSSMFCFVVARWSGLPVEFVSAEEEGFIRYVIGQPGFGEASAVNCK